MRTCQESSREKASTHFELCVLLPIYEMTAHYGALDAVPDRARPRAPRRGVAAACVALALAAVLAARSTPVRARTRRPPARSAPSRARPPRRRARRSPRASARSRAVASGRRRRRRASPRARAAATTTAATDDDDAAAAAASAPASARCAAADDDGAAAASSLSFHVTNEYGELSRHTRDLYGVSHVLEPFKRSTLYAAGVSGAAAARLRWRVVEANGTVTRGVGVRFVVVARSVGQVNVTLWLADDDERPAADARDAGLSGGGGAAAAGTAATTRPPRPRPTTRAAAGSGTYLSDTSAACLYVRRELRRLARADRERFLGALRLVYTLSADEGRARFGADFHPGIALAAKHNSDAWNFHFGCQFFTSHPSVPAHARGEPAAVDPTISHPYWDFMIDAGRDWQNSTVFSDDFGGPVRTSAADDWASRRARSRTCPRSGTRAARTRRDRERARTASSPRPSTRSRARTCSGARSSAAARTSSRWRAAPTRSTA